MKTFTQPFICQACRLMMFGWLAWPASGQVVFNEILFNPPETDAPNEFIELRGPPNYMLPAGTYLVAVDGDAENNPGLIQNVFELSGRALGGNGFLVLLQKQTPYAPSSKATVLANTNLGAGWGHGSSSSIGHKGESGKTDLVNASVTFFLVRSGIPPNPGQDIDLNNDGAPEGVYTNWLVMDSVGVLDNTGAGDYAYGALNFRRAKPPGNAAKASGVVVPVDFTPGYVARTGNTAGAGAADWAACNLLRGAAPNWVMDDTLNTWPIHLAGKPLDHLGNPNFGAAPLNGVVAVESGGDTQLAEGRGTDVYTVALNTPPAGNVTIEILAADQVQISTDGGNTFGGSQVLTFSDTTPQSIMVRALDDNVIDASPQAIPIYHRIISTGDALRYPTNTLGPVVYAKIIDNDELLLSELKVNPPTVDEAPYEFIELRGAPGALLGPVSLLAIDGRATGDPGVADVVMDLQGARLGSSGLLLIVADGHPYSVPPGCSVWLENKLNQPGGGLRNSAVSFLLVATSSPIREHGDLDNGDNGYLEGLPENTRLLDAVGWRGGDTNDWVYGGVILAGKPGTPDAVARFPGNHNPLDPSAWFYGDLAGVDGTTLWFDPKHVSDNFPAGTPLTPGMLNNTAPLISGLGPIAGAIGDPTNPTLDFTVEDREAGPYAVTLAITSSNAAVLPEENMELIPGVGGDYTLFLDPVGIGYSLITVSASDGVMTNAVSFLYAASEPDRPTARFHTGASDASTAIPLDADYMLIGDDENQTVRLYRRHESGPPVAGFNFTPFLGLTDIEAGVPREVDIEASTRAGSRIYWMGAHSHANIAEGRTNRSRIFATDLAGAGTNITLAYVGRYDYLKLDLAAWDAGNRHGRGANYYGIMASTEEGVNPKDPAGAGFNIEGLAMAPGSVEAAYAAFRAPIVPASLRTHALVVPVLNFATLAVGNGPSGSAVFGEPIELDLYGRGIRSLERQGATYLIIAGPPGDFPGAYPNDFRLYTWSGNPAEPPVQRACDLANMNLEGIVELPEEPWTPDSLIQVINDSGRKIWYQDGLIAKLLTERAHKKFRSDWVRLGEAVNPDPIITELAPSGPGAVLHWRARKGLKYQVQYRANLESSAWVDLPGMVLAEGPYASKTDSEPFAGRRFYRVMVAP